MIVLREQLIQLQHKTLVLCHGVYDILSFAHVRHLKWAKALGDELIVSITADPFVAKGKERPHFTADLRAEMINELRSVDYVVINYNETAIPLIKVLKPQFYVKGRDTEGADKFDRERQEVKLHGGQVVFSPNFREYHTSDILNRSQSNKVNVAPEKSGSMAPW